MERSFACIRESIAICSDQKSWMSSRKPHGSTERADGAPGSGSWVTELSGAVIAAAGHWIDRYSAHRHAACPEVAGASRSGLFSVLQEAQKRVDFNLQRMTRAIAHHDFAGARAYYFEDLKARDDLRKLRDRYGFDDDEKAVR